MKPINILDEILNHPVKIKILRHLIHGHKTPTGRELARMANVSQPAVIRPLVELVSQGILGKKVVGKSYVYNINEKNIIVSQGLIPLFQLEDNLLNNLASDLKRSLPKGIDSAIWYGSVARGTAQARSDWDILLLCPDEKTIKKAQSVVDSKEIEWSNKYSTRLDIKIRKTKSFLKELRFALTKLPDSEITFEKCIYEDYIHSQIQNPLFGESLTKLLGELP